MLTGRDVGLLCLLEDLAYITPTYAAPHLYPSTAVARRRLLDLMRGGYLARTASGVGREAIYYLHDHLPPTQIEHSLGILSMWHKAMDTGQLVSFRTEVVCGPIRPDAIIRHGDYIYCYEYERASHPSAFSRKVKAYESWVMGGGWREFGVVPIVLVEASKPDQVREVIERSQTIREMRWITCENPVDILCMRVDNSVIVPASVRW